MSRDGLALGLLVSLAVAHAAAQESALGGMKPPGPEPVLVALDLREPGRLAVSLRSNEFDPILLLVGPDGESFVNDDHDGLHSFIEIGAAAAGRWYAALLAYGGSEGGHYSVRIEGAAAVSHLPESALPSEIAVRMASMLDEVRPVTLSSAEGESADAGGLTLELEPVYPEQAAPAPAPAQDPYWELQLPPLVSGNRGVTIATGELPSIANRGAVARNGTADRPSGGETAQPPPVIAHSLPEPTDEDLAPLLPWPPPRPSGRFAFPWAVWETGGPPPTLGDLDDRLRAALAAVGHDELGYYAVPGGFAAVTRLERMEEDGRAVEQSRRWTLGPEPLRSFSLADYIHRLFDAEPGYFRLIAFVVTPNAFAAGEPAPFSLFERWAMEGANVLPARLRTRLFSQDTIVTALVYEFTKSRGAETARLEEPGRLTGRQHLVRAGILSALGGMP